MVQLLIAAAILSGLLYVSIRGVADAAVEQTQDGIMAAAATAISEQLREVDGEIEADIPYSAFSMLGSNGEDRVFYRILVDGVTLTGYDDLPLPEGDVTMLVPSHYTRPFRDTEVRIAAVQQTILSGGRPAQVMVLVAQTRLGQASIAAFLANQAAALGLGFFVVAALLALLAAGIGLRPLGELAAAVGRRGPQDLRPFDRSVPSELAPFVTAFNGFVARLSAALSRTETFIAEAAHHVRTPLATVRTEAEIALRLSNDDQTRASLRNVIRAVEESSRSASQLLDHATVAYRSDRRSETELDLTALAREVSHGLTPTADLKDLTLKLSLPDRPVTTVGDALMLECALRNLIDNAIKYSTPDGEIEIGLVAAGSWARIIVSDRGRGLSDDAAETLTRRFQRGSNVDDVIGSGLGLTIVAEVAKAHGGNLNITNREGGGTCAQLSVRLR
ncbi:MAG: sensor histidine kinase [Rhizobiales bacterium]|nr:sensor histidine kinase [Hyphomicrobiales bacterium]